MNKKTISKNVQRHVHGYWHTSVYMHIKLLGHKISTLNFFFSIFGEKIKFQNLNQIWEVTYFNQLKFVKRNMQRKYGKFMSKLFN